MNDIDEILFTDYIKHNYKKWLLAIIVILVIIMITDSYNQKSFYICNEGYRLMEEGNLNEAYVFFDKYLNMHSKLYFKIYEIVNGSADSYGYESVSGILRELKLNIKVDTT